MMRYIVHRKDHSLFLPVPFPPNPITNASITEYFNQEVTLDNLISFLMDCKQKGLDKLDLLVVDDDVEVSCWRFTTEEENQTSNLIDKENYAAYEKLIETALVKLDTLYKEKHE
jgi:hypothetical protein